MSDPGMVRLSSDMGITHAEFYRLLPAALAGRPYTLRQNEVLITDADRCITITLSQEGRHVIGRLRLPMTRVDFAFVGYALPEVETFMQRFRLHFQRGGG